MLEIQNYDIFQESSQGNNLYLAIFEREDNPEKIIAKTPWSFDKQLILLKHFHCDISPYDVKFQFSLFWIRV